MSAEIQYISEIKLFSKHLRELRKTKGLTQNQLKDLSGITQSQISLLEKEDTNSNPEFDTLVKLSWGLKIAMASLFAYSTKSIVPNKGKYKSLEQRATIEKQKFGIRIENLCKHRKLKQDDLAVLSRIDSADLSRFINGEGNIEFFSMLKLAVALEVKMFDLFDYDGPLPENKGFKGKI